MTEVTLEHFKRAISDISANGDNDTLPFDVDNRFISENQEELANIAFGFSEGLEKGSKKSARNLIDELPIFSERLLVPTGTAGFRITTKIRTHPTKTPGRCDLPLIAAQAAAALLCGWFVFQFQGSRSAILLAG
jgi:hypothetical protein